MNTPVSRPFRAPKTPRRRAAPASNSPRKRTLPPLPVFIAYDDIPAAREALGQSRDWCRARDPNREVQPMLWRLNQLDRPRLREMALGDAAEAAAIVLALGNAETLPEALERWLCALAIRRPHAGVTLLGLVDGEPWTISLAPSAVQRVPAETLRLVTPAEKTRGTEQAA